jgi:hypothetical protein
LPISTLVEEQLALCGSIRAVHPDDFLDALLSSPGSQVINSVKAARSKLVRRPLTVAEHIAHLERSGLPAFAAALRRHEDRLA